MSQKITDGNVIIRAGSEDPVTLALLEDDGITPIDLTGTTNHTIRMKVRNADTTKILPESRVAISGAATLGKIKISQLAADFPSAITYEYYVTLVDAAGKARAIPENGNYIWTVIAAITS